MTNRNVFCHIRRLHPPSSPPKKPHPPHPPHSIKTPDIVTTPSKTPPLTKRTNSTDPSKESPGGVRKAARVAPPPPKSSKSVEKTSVKPNDDSPTAVDNLANSSPVSTGNGENDLINTSGGDKDSNGGDDNVLDEVS